MRRRGTANRSRKERKESQHHGIRTLIHENIRGTTFARLTQLDNTCRRREGRVETYASSVGKTCAETDHAGNLHQRDQGASGGGLTARRKLRHEVTDFGEGSGGCGSRTRSRAEESTSLESCNSSHGGSSESAKDRHLKKRTEIVNRT